MLNSDKKLGPIFIHKSEVPGLPGPEIAAAAREFGSSPTGSGSAIG